MKNTESSKEKVFNNIVKNIEENSKENNNELTQKYGMSEELKALLNMQQTKTNILKTEVTKANTTNAKFNTLNVLNEEENNESEEKTSGIKYVSPYDYTNKKDVKNSSENSNENLNKNKIGYKESTEIEVEDEEIINELTNSSLDTEKESKEAKETKELKKSKNPFIYEDLNNIKLDKEVEEKNESKVDSSIKKEKTIVDILKEAEEKVKKVEELEQKIQKGEKLEFKDSEVHEVTNKEIQEKAEKKLEFLKETKNEKEETNSIGYKETETYEVDEDEIKEEQEKETKKSAKKVSQDTEKLSIEERRKKLRDSKKKEPLSMSEEQLKALDNFFGNNDEDKKRKEKDEKIIKKYISKKDSKEHKTLLERQQESIIDLEEEKELEDEADLDNTLSYKESETYEVNDDELFTAEVDIENNVEENKKKLIDTVEVELVSELKPDENSKKSIKEIAKNKKIENEIEYKDSEEFEVKDEELLEQDTDNKDNANNEEEKVEEPVRKYNYGYSFDTIKIDAINEKNLYKKDNTYNFDNKNTVEELYESMINKKEEKEINEIKEEQKLSNPETNPETNPEKDLQKPSGIDVNSVLREAALRMQNVKKEKINNIAYNESETIEVDVEEITKELENEASSENSKDQYTKYEEFLTNLKVTGEKIDSEHEEKKNDPEYKKIIEELRQEEEEEKVLKKKNSKVDSKTNILRIAELRQKEIEENLKKRNKLITMKLETVNTIDQKTGEIPLRSKEQEEVINEITSSVTNMYNNIDKKRKRNNFLFGLLIIFEILVIALVIGYSYLKVKDPLLLDQIITNIVEFFRNIKF